MLFLNRINASLEQFNAQLSRVLITTFAKMAPTTGHAMFGIMFTSAGFLLFAAVAVWLGLVDPVLHEYILGVPILVFLVAQSMVGAEFLIRLAARLFRFLFVRS